MGEWVGVAIALLSSCLGGSAAAITRYLVSGADPIALAILRFRAVVAQATQADSGWIVSSGGRLRRVVVLSGMMCLVNG